MMTPGKNNGDQSKTNTQRESKHHDGREFCREGLHEAIKPAGPEYPDQAHSQDKGHGFAEVYGGNIQIGFEYFLEQSHHPPVYAGEKQEKC